MNLYSSLTRAAQAFEPLGDVVTVYLCGITPYDTTHLGHAFTSAAADVLIRYLEYHGLRVKYVQNVTDVDDDILKKAAGLRQDWKQLGDYWTAHYIQDMLRLNMRPPDEFVRATDAIDQIIEQVKALLGAGVAYTGDGNVYFNIDAWEEFGKLSRLGRDEMLPIANERGNRPDDPHKRDPLDFVLWQAQAPGEPAWKSPWGPGRPGWHIECSTMATHFLGPVVDVHIGGEDLVFPHHECEIAQVEPVTGKKPFVRYWMHTAMVRYEGEKMSKSLGNLVMARDLLEGFSPDALRYYLASHHYRSPWDHHEDEVRSCAARLEQLRQAVSISGGRSLDEQVADMPRRFEAAMDDDLNTPLALKRLDDMAESILAAAEAGKDVGPAQMKLRQLASVFGLVLDRPGPEPRVREGWGRHRQRFIGEQASSEAEG